MLTMINAAVTAATSNPIDPRAGCGTTAVLEEAVKIGKVGLTLVCMPCNISFVPALLVDISGDSRVSKSLVGSFRRLWSG